MPVTDVPQLEESIEIAAAPERVWALVADPRNMRRWSPQTWRSFLRPSREPDGEKGPGIGVGTRFVSINRKGLLVWPTRSKVVRYQEGREIAWRVRDNFTIWSLSLEPTEVRGEPGTRLVQRREVPQGISDVSARLTDLAMGGQERFTAALQAGMRQTLAGIRADAER